MVNEVIDFNFLRIFQLAACPSEALA